MKLSSLKTLHRRQTTKDFNERRYGKEWQPGPSGGPRIEAIIKLAGSGGKVLDVGCGDGTISRIVQDAGNDVYAIDISETAVQLAKAKGINAIRIDLENEDKLPFEDDFFDVAIMAEIIEHFFDTDYFLAKIKRVLKNGGHIVLTTPNLASLGRRLLLLWGRDPLTEVRIEDNSAGHVRYFTKETLFQILKANNFKIVNFYSDVVNFDNSGRIYSIMLARLIPTLGRTLIVRASLNED
ncbi:MAG: class I SAM-dependent methyltransferase [Actinobacteria bacterium]|nr:class I SAM-dependent methyltransferase [Actinomycetota bacterium]